MTTRLTGKESEKQEVSACENLTAEVTPRARQVLRAVRECIFEGRSPTVRELCRITGIPSVSSVWKELQALETAGLISVARGNARGITLTQTDGTVSAAVPVITHIDPITGDIRPKDPEEFIPFILPQRAVGISYAVKVKRDVGELKEGDIVVFCRMGDVKSDSAAMILFNNALTVGTVEERADGGYAWLGERDYKLGAEADVAVVGKVLGIIRRFF